MPCIYKMRILGGVTRRESSNVFLLRMQALLNSEVPVEQRMNIYIYIAIPSPVSLFSFCPVTTSPSFSQDISLNILFHQPKMCKA